MAFKMSKDMYARIEALETDILDFAQEKRDEWDERSESWQESDAGQAADAWIETIENLAGELESLEDSA